MHYSNSTLVGGRGQLPWNSPTPGQNNTEELHSYKLVKVKPTMSEAMEQEHEQEQQEPKKRLRPFGPKSTTEARNARIQRLYKRQLEGLPVRQLVMEHSVKEQIGIATAWRDWKGVYELVAEDFAKERDKMSSRIFAQRQRLFNAAVKRGQMQTAANVLDSLARQVGCDQPEVSETLPEIHVKIEKPD